MPVSNHAMAWFGSAGGTLSLSEKWFGELPSTLKKPDPARRRSIFATSIRFDDVTRMPLPEGGSQISHRGEAHVLGGVQANGWRGVRDVVFWGGSHCLTGDDGSPLEVPFDGTFLT